MNTLKTILKNISMNEDCIQFVEKLLNENDYNSFKGAYYENKLIFFEKIKEQSNWKQWILGFYCSMIEECYLKFKNKFDVLYDEIFFDSFKDIVLWANSCKDKYGYYGIEEIKWVSNTIDLNLFRIGRLQFRLYPLEKDFIINETKLLKNQLVVSIHIPKDGKLDYKNCVDSIKLAYKFFDEKYRIFYCKSWLLDNRLKLILNENSNIIKFQKLFQIVETQDNDTCEKYVYNNVYNDKTKYIEQTTLQKDLKKYLINGGKIGSSIGFIIFKDNYWL